MIRIVTRFPVMGRVKYKVSTIFYGGKWHTIATDMPTKSTEYLVDAGQNHLDMALLLKKKAEGLGT